MGLGKRREGYVVGHFVDPDGDMIALYGAYKGTQCTTVNLMLVVGNTKVSKADGQAQGWHLEKSQRGRVLIKDVDF
jgi:hypothetical protein